MNLILTNECNRNCPYCFAKLKLADRETQGSEQRAFISLENVATCLDFLERSHCRTIRLLGGEPTLHPHFVEIVHRCVERKFEISIFTNGLWDDATCESILKIRTDDPSVALKILFNVNEPQDWSPAEKERIPGALRAAGSIGGCGFNIYREDFSVLFVADLVETYQLDKTLRLGLASPIFGTENSFISPDQMKAIGSRLVEQLGELEKHDIIAGFDCAFPLCMFDTESLGKLTLFTYGFESACDFPVDIGPDLSVWPCYPLSGFSQRSLLDFADRDEIKEHFKEQLHMFDGFGVFDECVDCRFLKRAQCCGGCLAYKLTGWQTGDDASILDKVASKKGSFTGTRSTDGAGTSNSNSEEKRGGPRCADGA